MLCLGVVPQGIAASPDERFLVGLRERHLYRLAEKFGTDRSGRNDLTDRERADLAIQLALVYTQHALASPPAARAELWTKADEACAGLGERWPANPWRQLVDVQSALVALAHGEQLREEAAGSTRNAARFATALEHLRNSSRRLQQIGEQADQELIERRMGRSARRSSDGLSIAELESLVRHISLQLARALRQQAMCFAPRTADRDDALLRAVARLEPLAQQSTVDELVWDARVELIACSREMGRLEAAAKRIAAWSADQPPADVATRLATEQVRVLLSAGQIKAALQYADQATQTSSTGRSVGGDLALARLEASLAAWRRAPPADQKRDAQDVMSQVDAIRTRYGPYWARRAELLAGRALVAAGPTNDAASLLLAAEHLYFNGQTNESLAAYDRAARLLRQNEQHEQAFQVSMSAAAIERTGGQLQNAANRYRQLAASRPGHERAAEAHALAILCTADLLRNASADDLPPLAASYERLLVEHPAHWPDSPRADDARWWLSQLLVGRHDWPAAIKTLQAIRPASAHFAAAVRSTVDCYEHLLVASNLAAAAGRQRQAATLADATKYLQRIVTGPDNRWPAEWSELERNVAVELAQMHLRYADDGAPYAERLLTAALRGPAAGPTNESSAAWGTRARSLLVIARARTGQPVSGREYDEAVATYAELAKQRADDGAIQESYAMLLAQGRSDGVLREALAQWQQVEQRSRRGGPRWRRARTARIDLLGRLGDRDEADKLLRLTRLLYPDWDSRSRQSH